MQYWLKQLLLVLQQAQVVHQQDLLDLRPQATGPPAAGPTGPPAAGPSGAPEVASPVVQEVVETPVVVEEQVEAVGDVYEDQGDGWFFRKLPDGSYDQTVYVVEDGQYVPYVEPEA